MIDYIFVLFSCWSSENRVLYMDNALVGLILPKLCPVCHLFLKVGTGYEQHIKTDTGNLRGVIEI